MAHDSRAVMNPATDELKTAKTQGILASALLLEALTNREIDFVSHETPYSFKEWESPSYKERLKKSYAIIKDFFGSFK